MRAAWVRPAILMLTAVPLFAGAACNGSGTSGSSGAPASASAMTADQSSSSLSMPESAAEKSMTAEDPETVRPLLGLPVHTMADVSAIREAFSASTVAPWGFVHNGIDFTPNPPTGSTVEYIAAAPGRVLSVAPVANNVTGNWQVNVEIRLIGPGSEAEHETAGAGDLERRASERTGLGLTYIFETFSQSIADRDMQMSLLAVSPGNYVRRGMPIGRLWAFGNGAHVHFGVLTGVHAGGISGAQPVAVCPDPFFMSTARAAILAKLDETWPGAAMCYP